MITVYSHTPNQSTCPWYVYANIAIERIKATLASVGIVCSVVEQRNKIDNPIGTGPGGRVRFGDDMLPSTYHIQVDEKYEKKAKAILVHQVFDSTRERAFKLLTA